MKKLYRSEKNKIFAGIFGGLGEYTEVDPVIFRLIWLFVTIFTGFFPGIFFYFFAVLVIPKKQEK